MSGWRNERSGMVSTSITRRICAYTFRYYQVLIGLELIKDARSEKAEAHLGGRLSIGDSLHRTMFSIRYTISPFSTYRHDQLTTDMISDIVGPAYIVFVSSLDPLIDLEIGQLSFHIPRSRQIQLTSNRSRYNKRCLWRKTIPSIYSTRSNAALLT